VDGVLGQEVGGVLVRLVLLAAAPALDDHRFELERGAEVALELGDLERHLVAHPAAPDRRVAHSREQDLRVADVPPG